MGISRHLLDDNWAVREKKETGSTFVPPAIRTLWAYLMASKTFSTGVI